MKFSKWKFDKVTGMPTYLNTDTLQKVISKLWNIKWNNKLTMKWNFIWSLDGVLPGFSLSSVSFLSDPSWPTHFLFWSPSCQSIQRIAFHFISSLRSTNKSVVLPYWLKTTSKDQENMSQLVATHNIDSWIKKDPILQI